jgi:hypothetical protein
VRLKFLCVHLEDATLLAMIDRIDRGRGRRYRVYCSFCSKFLEGAWSYEGAVGFARKHLEGHGISEALLVEVTAWTLKNRWVEHAALFSIPTHIAEKVARLEGAVEGQERTIKELVKENAELFKRAVLSI